MPDSETTELTTTEREIIDVTQRLLQSIFSGDWKTYTELCSADLTAIEPEARGHLVQGLAFHKYYFDLPSVGDPPPVNISIASPHVRLMGDVAVIAYVRLVQTLDATAAPVTRVSEETRVWQRQDGRWVHVHFHRSPV